MRSVVLRAVSPSFHGYADAERIAVYHKHRALEIHAPRLSVEPRRIPISPAPFQLLNPDAEPC